MYDNNLINNGKGKVHLFISATYANKIHISIEYFGTFLEHYIEL